MQYKPEYAWLSDACLNLTDDCNLACRYCFVEQHPHYMTLDTAKAAVDYLIHNLRRKKETGYLNSKEKATITFFGGEPTILWDEIIVPLVAYAEEVYPNEITFSITTNGTLLSEERIKFLYNHQIQPLLSIDGAPETQNYNRPCKNQTILSADKVMKNIPYLLHYFPDITFRSTIYQETVEHTFENYIFAQYLGFKNIFLMPNCRTPWTEEQIAILQEEYAKIYQYITECFQMGLGNPIYCMTINNSFEQVLKHDLDVMTDQLSKKEDSRSIIRCGMGTTMGSIGYDGSIYGCQEQDSKDKKNIFYIGNIYNGIDESIHHDLLEKYATKGTMNCEDPDYCEKCPLCSQCQNFSCPSTIWDLYKDFHTDSKIHCQWIRIMFEQAAKAMNILVQQNNSLFKEYLYVECHFQDYWQKEEHHGKSN